MMDTSGPNSPEQKEPSATAVMRLEAELRSTKEQLRASIENYETRTEELRTSNERLRLLVESAKEHAIYTMDAGGRIDYWNTGAQILFGYTESEIVGQSAALLDTPEDRESNVLERGLREAHERGSAEDERWHVRRNGTRFYASGVLTLLHDRRIERGGTAQGYAMIARDLTGRKVAKDSIRFQTLLLDTIEQSVIATDLDGIVIYWNQFAQKLYGWTAQEAIGRNIMELTTPEIMTGQALEIMSQLRQGQSWAGEFKVQRRDGMTFPAQIINSPINDDEGTLIGIVGVSVDITERKRQEASLVELTSQIERQARVFNTTLSSITDFAYIFNHDGRFVYANQALLDLWERTLDEAMGKNFFELQYPDELALRLQQQIQQVFDTRQGLRDETPYTSPTGVEGYYEYIFSPVFAADGTVEVVAGSTRNITERKRAESALRESEERFRAMFEQANVGIVQSSIDGVLLKVNPGFCKIIGYSEEEAVGLLIRDITHRDDHEREKALTRQLVAGESPGYMIEKRYLHKDGRLVWGNMTATLVRQSSGEPIYMVSIVEDITERKQVEDALHASRVELLKSNNELERRVTERTAALSETNDILQEEVRERRRIEAERVELLRRVIFAQEDERRRIAREMHDQFGQSLSVLTLKLAALKEESGEHEKLRQQLEILEVVAKQLDSDVDFLVWELRPTVLDDLGLPAALKAYLQNWSNHFGVHADLHMSGKKHERLTGEIETVLYRIAQEALNNIAKHARAEKVGIILEHRDRHVSLIIEDDGVGFDGARAFGEKDKGLGLIGMRERAALVGGTAEIESHPDGGGTTVIVRIPAPPVPRQGEQDE